MSLPMSLFRYVNVINLALGFPNLNHVQLANSFLDLQGGDADGYVWCLLIGAITEGFLSMFWLFNEGGASDMLFPSLCPCPLATLVQFVKGKTFSSSTS